MENEEKNEKKKGNFRVKWERVRGGRLIFTPGLHGEKDRGNFSTAG